MTEKIKHSYSKRKSYNKNHHQESHHDFSPSPRFLIWPWLVNGFAALLVNFSPSPRFLIWLWLINGFAGWFKIGLPLIWLPLLGPWCSTFKVFVGTNSSAFFLTTNSSSFKRNSSINNCSSIHKPDHYDLQLLR